MTLPVKQIRYDWIVYAALLPGLLTLAGIEVTAAIAWHNQAPWNAATVQATSLARFAETNFARPKAAVLTARSSGGRRLPFSHRFGNPPVESFQMRQGLNLRSDFRVPPRGPEEISQVPQAAKLEHSVFNCWALATRYQAKLYRRWPGRSEKEREIRKDGPAGFRREIGLIRRAAPNVIAGVDRLHPMLRRLRQVNPLSLPGSAICPLKQTLSAKI
jgi:hypothetical protein